MTKKKLESFIVKARLKWPCLTKHNKKSKKYTADLYDLSPEAVKKLQSFGIEMRKNTKQGDEDFGKMFVSVSSKVYPISVLNSKKEPIEDNVGNGTIANVLVKPYKWTYEGDDGISLGASAVQVLELVSRGDISSAFPDVEDSEELIDDSTPF
jgi:hypothetical protein